MRAAALGSNGFETYPPNAPLYGRAGNQRVLVKGPHVAETNRVTVEDYVVVET